MLQSVTIQKQFTVTALTTEAYDAAVNNVRATSPHLTIVENRQSLTFVATETVSETIDV